VIRTVPPSLPFTFTPRSTQHGFTLVEVLAAIVILALAASGAAAMQLHALRTAQDSAYQSAALQLAVELAELLRTSANADAYQFEYRAGAGPSAACARTDCDLTTWKQRLADALPRARVVVCKDDAPILNATLRWPCNGAGGPLLIKIGWATREPTTTQSEPPPILALPVEG